MDEETKRHEPWTGSVEYYKKNLDAFLSGTEFVAPSGNSNLNYKYEDLVGLGGFIGKYGDKKFIENLGEYEYDVDNSESTRSNKKRIIIYTLTN